MTKKLFWEKLRDRIELDDGLTDSGLAIKAGLDNSTIRRMIKNERNPRIDTIEKICAALGTTYQEFMGDDPDHGEKDLGVRAIRHLARQLEPELLRRLLDHGEELLEEQDHQSPKGG